MDPTSTPKDIAQSWLGELSNRISSDDIQGICDLLLPSNCWLKDHLILSWNLRSLHGEQSISEYLTNRLHKASIRDIQLDEEHGIFPNIRVDPETGFQTLEAAFKFDTHTFKGRGYCILVPYPDSPTWKALSVSLIAADLQGHEENKTPPTGYYADHAQTWTEHVEEEREQTEKDPTVIIVGAAQSGLTVGARFKQMGIRALLIEQSDRVGDTWRNRYPGLTLHTPNPHHSMLYARYPENWPIFTPKEKFADALEQYAINQELVVWTRSTILPTPTYDPGTKRWTVRISKAGEEITLYPYHIVSAIGINGDPHIPSIAGIENFKGFHCHSGNYKGPKEFVGKSVVVVGACQSSADICQGLALHNSKVTMIQRSGTIVTSADYVRKTIYSNFYPIGVDAQISDFRAYALPTLLFQILQRSEKDRRVREQKDMLEGLKAAGFNATEGKDGGGLWSQYFDAMRGYWIDNGVAKLISEGRIKVKSGTEIERFTQDGIIFKDETFLQADAVIFATGYQPVKNSVVNLFGEDFATKVTPVWGIDEDGELRRAYKPSGQPGYWWALGDLTSARYGSKLLAIQIKARLLGMITEDEI